MIYYTTFENWVDAAILTDIEILPNIRGMVLVLPYYPTYMIIDRVLLRMICYMLYEMGV